MTSPHTNVFAINPSSAHLVVVVARNPKMTLPISHPRSAIGPAIRSNIRAPLFLGFPTEKSTPTRPRFSPRSYSCRRGRPTQRLHIGRVDDEDAVFRALADTNRRLLDRLRRKNGQTLSELCEGHDMTRQAVTKHLAVLEEANLVATTKKGREKLHFLNPVPINEIYMRWIGKFEQGRLQALHNLKQALQE